MDVMGEADPIDPDEEPRLADEPVDRSTWVEGLGIGSLVLAAGSAVGPSSSLPVLNLRNALGGYYGMSEPNFLRDYLYGVGGHVVLAVPALLLGLVALRRLTPASPRWIRSVAAGGVVTAVAVLVLVAIGAAWFELDPPQVPEEFSEDFTQ
jgi:hypothetical protein